MRVALNVELTYSNPTGMGTYARELVREFRRTYRGVEFIGLRSATAGDSAEDRSTPWWREHRLPYSRKALVAAALMQVPLPGLVPEERVDLYHDLASARFLTKRPYLVTVHDTAVLDVPEAYAWHSRALFRLQRRHVRRASAVVTSSECSRQALLAKLDLEPERVHTIHAGVAPTFKPTSWEAVEESTVTAPMRQRPYIVFAGVDNPRKNLATLLQAFRRHVQEAGTDLELVLTGPMGIAAQGSESSIQQMGLDGRVRRTGYVSAAELAAIFSNARALMFPSISEGFGLPVLEAMACGCPVFCSDIPVLREVGGDAATYIEPCDVNAWAGAIADSTHNGDSRDKQIAAGLKRVNAFSWASTADKICAVYRRVESIH